MFTTKITMTQHDELFKESYSFFGTLNLGANRIGFSAIFIRNSKANKS